MNSFIEGGQRHYVAVADTVFVRVPDPVVGHARTQMKMLRRGDVVPPRASFQHLKKLLAAGRIREIEEAAE